MRRTIKVRRRPRPMDRTSTAVPGYSLELPSDCFWECGLNYCIWETTLSQLYERLEREGLEPRFVDDGLVAYCPWCGTCDELRIIRTEES